MRTDILDVINNAFEKHPQQGDRIFADGVETAGAEVYGYIYLILDIDTKTVVYVGQSTNPRYRTSLQESQKKLPDKKLFMLVVDSYREYWRVVGYVNIVDLETAYTEFFFKFNLVNNLCGLLNKTITSRLATTLFFHEVMPKSFNGNDSFRNALSSKQSKYICPFIEMHNYEKAKTYREATLKRLLKTDEPISVIMTKYYDIFPVREEYRYIIEERICCRLRAEVLRSEEDKRREEEDKRREDERRHLIEEEHRRLTEEERRLTEEERRLKEKHRRLTEEYLRLIEEEKRHKEEEKRHKEEKHRYYWSASMRNEVENKRRREEQLLHRKEDMRHKARRKEDELALLSIVENSIPWEIGNEYE